jgi:SAM-dependent methyltransferase
VDEWAAFFNSYAEAEDPIGRAGYCVDGVPLDPQLHRAAVVEPWLEKAELEPHHHVLEVGCASGLLLREIEARVERAVGTDPAEAQLRRYEGSAETYVCAAHELPFEEEQFDRILMASVAPCFPSFAYFRGVIESLVRLLRQRGIALIADVPLGPQPQGTPYLWYEPMDIISVLEPLDVGFSIEAQSPLKRTINRRYDIALYKS